VAAVTYAQMHSPTPVCTRKWQQSFTTTVDGVKFRPIIKTESSEITRFQGLIQQQVVRDHALGVLALDGSNLQQRGIRNGVPCCYSTGRRGVFARLSWIEEAEPPRPRCLFTAIYAYSRGSEAH
jgi:hypothetical protein